MGKFENAQFKLYNKISRTYSSAFLTRSRFPYNRRNEEIENLTNVTELKSFHRLCTIYRDL